MVTFLGNQSFWGQRVADLGVGPSPILWKKPAVDTLADIIHEVLDDQAIRMRAVALGSLIRSEDGFGRAVEVIPGYENRDGV